MLTDRTTRTISRGGLEQVLRKGRVFLASPDAIVSPTFVPDPVKACPDRVVDGEPGIWHPANGGAVSRLEFGQPIAGALDLDPAQVRAASPAHLGWRAKRPHMPPWHRAGTRCCRRWATPSRGMRG